MTTPLKVLIAADGHGAEIYATALAEGFTELGHQVTQFHWKEYFHNYPYANVYKTDGNKLKSIYYRAQNKFTFGPAVWRLNRDLIAQTRKLKPQLVFIYRGTHIWPSTITALKKTGALVAGYNNDDPFSSVYKPYFWRHFMKGIPLYNHLFAYRTHNLSELQGRGQPNVSLLRAYYVPARNFPIRPKPVNDYSADVIFIGHYEADGRDEMLLHLINNGINFKLYGTDWHLSRHKAAFEKHMGGPIKPLYKEDYNTALNSAQIALVFLSKLNRDTYTRRSFEIPATGTLMMSEYTADLAENLFTPNTEAAYFASKEDLLNQLQTLLNTPEKLAAIAAAGHARLLKDGHTPTGRCRQILMEMKL